MPQAADTHKLALTAETYMPWPFHVALAASALIEVVAGAATGTVAPFFVVPLVVAIWVTFLVLRVEVTPEVIRIRFGIVGVFGPIVPVEAITDAAVATRPRTPRGWGAQWADDGTRAYVVPGPATGVRIAYASSGVPESVFASCSDPHRVIAGIERARARSRG